MSSFVERWQLAAGLAVVAVTGFAAKLYRGPGEDWFNDSLAGLLYVVFWCLAAALAWPKVPAIRITLTVLAATCVLEVLQLWQPPWLQAVRTTFLGATLLGTTFVASDLVYYVLGAGIGWLGIRWLR